MSLRIAFDLDGVLADMDSALDRQIQIVFGDSLERRQPTIPVGEGPPEAAPIVSRSAVMTSRQQRRLWRHIGAIDGFWESLEEIEAGAIRQLATTAVDRRWQIIFLTKRSETAGATSQMQTQRWLESHGFAMPSVYVVQGSRGRIAAALDLDFVVDDRPENCLDVVVDSKARAILVCREGQRQLPDAAKRLGICVVTSVAECLEIMTQVDTVATRERPGVINRVMRLLGVKESTTA
jgi:5' nucleotidase, deoxy (Pyrimidine), cytosolic type C protein (NT5C)